MSKANKPKIKPVAKKAAPKKVKVLKSALVAEAANASRAVEVTVEFRSGLGQITASLFRKGVLINMQSISTSGNINFSEVQSKDAISVNGICAGTAKIHINIPTYPATPENFEEQIILAGYIIL